MPLTAPVPFATSDNALCLKATCNMHLLKSELHLAQWLLLGGWIHGGLVRWALGAHWSDCAVSQKLPGQALLRYTTKRRPLLTTTLHHEGSRVEDTVLLGFAQLLVDFLLHNSMAPCTNKGELTLAAILVWLRLGG